MNKNHLWLGMLAVGVFTTCCTQSNAQAQTTFTTANGDVLLGFRQVVGGTLGTSDMVVNIGSISTYLNAAHAAGSSAITINQFTGTQLTTTFGSLANLSWSVGASCL